MLDTETANTPHINNTLDISSGLVYDIGGAVIDRHGKVYEDFSFVIREVFYDMPYVMNTAYYANKIPLYITDIEEGARSVVPYCTAKFFIRHLVKKYKIKAIVAHNARFDYNVCNSTERYLSKSKYRYFFPYGIEVWDTLKMARDVIANRPTYQRFCKTHGYITSNGRPRLTAEILYQYFTGNIDFTESHTGREDVEIEKLIFSKCMAAHKKMRRKLWE